MRNRKNHNSIVFLTTLSVYLGLVLVGTPPILAQAALTQKIEIQNEAEIKDDLDKKPDDDVIELFGATGGYFDDFENLIEDLKKLHQIEKFNLDYDTFHVTKSGVSECYLEGVGHTVATSNIDRIADRWLVAAIGDAADRFENYAFLGDCLSSDDLDKKKGVSFEIEIGYDKSSFKFELSVKKESPQKAKQLLDRFNQAYKIYELDEDEPIIKKIYENTSFKSENNQVFIVTRLPRASIDELLAKKDAK
jgi:hypothetical protein